MLLTADDRSLNMGFPSENEAPDLSMGDFRTVLEALNLWVGCCWGSIGGSLHRREKRGRRGGGGREKD